MNPSSEVQSTASATARVGCTLKPPGSSRWLCGLRLGVVQLLAMTWLAGCASTPGGGSWGGGSGGERIEELHLLGVPMALKMGRAGVPDGFAVRVFASERQRAKGVTIRNGSLAILMFDGPLGGVDPSTAKPARIWNFPAAALGAQASVSALGVGYQFVLGWEGAAPRQSRVTVLARFTPPQGSPVYSAPNVISVAGP